MIFLVSDFIELFENTNSELPFQTSFIISTYMFWALLSVPSFYSSYLLITKETINSWWFVAFSVVSVLVILPFTVWGLYAPVLATLHKEF